MPTPNLVNINLTEGTGIPAVGSLLYILNLDAPSIYIPIGNLGNMKWGLKIMDADTTNQGTVWKQGIPTLRDGGTITGDLHLVPSSPGADLTGTLEGHSFVDGLGHIAVNADVRQYKLVWPDGAGMFFSAYITDFPVDMQIEKDLLCNITWKVSGPPTFFDAEVGGVTAQTITFGALSAKDTTDVPFTVAATASSGLTPTFVVTSGPATISGTLVTLTGAPGTVVITASQIGNLTYAAATPVPQSFVVS
jgi:hypothetical protein